MRLRTWGLALAATVAVAAVIGVPLAISHGSSGHRDGPPDAAPTSSAGVEASVATRVVPVSPVDGRGQVRPGYRVATSAAGHCFGSSLLNGRLYRCFRGNTILDPCWEQPGQRSVVCLPAPWSHRLDRLRLTAKLPSREAFPTRLWGLRMASGADCTASMGAAGLVGRQPISFLCDHGWVLLGEGPDQSSADWTMPAAHRTGGHYRTEGTRHLTAAWRAVLG